MTQSLKFVLSGTTQQLASHEALTILTTAAFCGVEITTSTSAPETGKNVVVGSSLTPLPHHQHQQQPQSLLLSMIQPTLSSSESSLSLCCLSSMNAAVRLISSSSSSSSAALTSLLGSRPLDTAQVDAWLSYARSSVEVSVQVLLRDANNAAAKEALQTSCTATLIPHLTYRTYMVGETITLADVRLAVLLYTAVQQGWIELSETDPSMLPLVRWYQTILHQDAFQRSLARIASGGVAASPTTSVVTTTTITTTTPATTTGVWMNGSPTPVQYHKYRRQRIRIKEILANQATPYLHQTLTVAGWARTIRKASSKLMFVELNDGSTGASLQCVLDSTITEGFEECKANGGTGASFQFQGTIVPSPGEGQLVDLKVTHATLLGAVWGGNPEGTLVGGMLYPLSKKEHTLEHMREQAHLRPRGQIHAAAMRIRHCMAYATHTFFHNHGFLYIHTPIITGADCEGAGEQFAITTMLGNDHLQPGIALPVHPPAPEISKSELKRLEKKKAKADPFKPQEEIVPGAVDYTKDFFGQRVNLTVSGQLNVETHACALSDVYTFGPTFRAEESRTYRHLSEFWMIEPEIAFADLNIDIDLAEDYLKYCVQFALEHCADDLEFFENNPHGEKGLRDRLRNVLDNEFKRLTYTEAIEILQKAVADGVVFETKPEWGIDLPSEHERYICEKVFNKPVVLYNYPKDIKAFYMKLNEDQRTVAAADVLVPKIGEIIGGSQREHRLDVLRQRCLDMKLDPRNVWWYLDLRRYGTVPHAGFGLGFERLILFITGLDNIRDVIPFPRWVGNAKF